MRWICHVPRDLRLFIHEHTSHLKRPDKYRHVNRGEGIESIHCVYEHGGKQK